MKRPVASCGIRVSPRGRFVSNAAFSLAAALLAAAPARSALAQGNSCEERPAIHSSRFSDPDPVTVQQWYGYQTLVIDVASTSLFVAGLATFRLCLSGSTSGGCNNDASGALLLSGLTGYALGGPVIHAAHGHWDKAGYSLALRVLPVAAATGVGAGGGAGGAAALLLIGGAGVAMMVDSAMLGYETVTVETPKVSLAPSFDPKSRTAGLVVAGSLQ